MPLFQSSSQVQACDGSLGPNHHCMTGIAQRSALCQWRTILVLAFILWFVTACGAVRSAASPAVQRAESFVLLPVVNLSRSPHADSQLQDLLEIRLRKAGVRNLHVSRSAAAESDLKAVLGYSARAHQALHQAAESGHRYAFGSVIHEWHYRDGAENEPSVAVSLKLTDLYSGRVLWQDNVARTGWGFSSLSSLGERVVSDLLKKVTLVGQAAQ